MHPFDPRRAILAGIETEYGLAIEGRGPEHQIEDATAFVKQLKTDCFEGWDYRHESPRADMRGFSVKHLSVDPVDAQFDEGRTPEQAEVVRADRILINGARFYNDHGHPEYATPELFTADQVALHDKAGELVLLRAARLMADQAGKQVAIYKNNTDFHGASYGTHESFLVPRSLPFEKLFEAVVPILIARTILTGAGKVGSESGKKVPYQMSCRADFFTEPVNVETLFRRPVFNTRDEPHADSNQWRRLHVIAGDANMMARCTARKIGLVQLAICLACLDCAPKWTIEDPVLAMKQLSRSPQSPFAIQLSRSHSVPAQEILESYFKAYESLDVPDLTDDPSLPPIADYHPLIAECRTLLNSLESGLDEAVSTIDWLAKRKLLEMVMEENGWDWDHPSLPSYDLAYHNIDPDEGLFYGLSEMEIVESGPTSAACAEALTAPGEFTRGWVRSLAIIKFRDHLQTASWSSLVFKDPSGRPIEVRLDPYHQYNPQLATISDVGTFISCLT